MTLFPSCWGKCSVCACGDRCFAGDGDDDFQVATEDQLIARLYRGEYLDYTGIMKDYLEKYYKYDYDKREKIPVEKEHGLIGEYEFFTKEDLIRRWEESFAKLFGERTNDK